MLHQIQRCTAPCVGLVSEAEYAEDVNSALLFLQGKTDEVLAQLKRQMEAASGALQFERAARVRDKIHRMQQLQSRQFVESATAGDIDVVAAALEDGVMAVNVVMIRGGRHVGDRTFFPRQAMAGTPAEGITAFLPQHYVERPVPPTIIAPEAEDDAPSDVPGQHRGVEDHLGAGGLGVFPERGHESVAVHDAGGGREQAPDRSHLRLERAHVRTAEPAKVVDPARHGPRLDGFQRRDLLLPGRDDDLPQPGERHPALAAVGVEGVTSLDA